MLRSASVQRHAVVYECACMQFAVRVVLAVLSPRRQKRTVLALYVTANFIFHTDYFTELRLSWQRGEERVAWSTKMTAMNIVMTTRIRRDVMHCRQSLMTAGRARGWQERDCDVTSADDNDKQFGEDKRKRTREVTGWVVPDNYVIPTSEDIKPHIIRSHVTSV